MPLKEPRRFRPELAAPRLACKHPRRSVTAEGGLRYATYALAGAADAARSLPPNLERPAAAGRTIALTFPPARSA